MGVKKRLDDLDIKLSMTSAAIDHALVEAYDPELGARPLRRYLEKYIVSAISKKIVAGEMMAGCIADVDFDGIEWSVRTHPRVEGEQDDEFLRADSNASKRTNSCTSNSDTNLLSSK